MENTYEGNKMHYPIWFKVLVLAALTAIVLVAIVMALRRPDMNDRFSVSATGKVTAIPDIATVTIGVYTDAKDTAAEAVKENTEKMNDIIQALKGIDIEKKDITTSSYSLNPVYDWTDDSGRTLKGYEVRQNVTIKVRNLDNIGKAIQVTTEEGANQIGGISFTIDDPEELRQEAVKIAIDKAKAKADELSDASGLKLGKLINMYETQSYYPELRTNQAYYDEAIGLGGGGVPQPTIEAGEQEIQVEVTLMYEVK